MIDDCEMKFLLKDLAFETASMFEFLTCLANGQSNAFILIPIWIFYDVCSNCSNCERSPLLLFTSMSRFFSERF